ncbi:MAG: hypothetical protein AB8B83_05730 [Bdellovibrionales bacterium]
MKNFETYVGIDWSGAKSPIKTPSIAVAMCQQGKCAPQLLYPPHKENAQNRNPQNRNKNNRNKNNRNNWSRNNVFQWIQSLEHRTLIGIDANFGYSEIIGQKQFGNNYDYNDLWCAVERESKRCANFFAGGYWQSNCEFFWTQGKMPPNMQFPKRQTEIICRERGFGHPESPFKLIGAKQVGKGGLSAMRMAYALKEKMGNEICIWPFEQDIANSAKIVITEIFPRQFLMRSGHGITKVKTIEELNNTLIKLDCKNKYDTNCFNDHDADAIVSAAGLRMLCGTEKNIPKSISHPKSINSSAIKREGWIFGV